jgi:N-acetylneuraminic acid mutarotase
MRIRNLALLLLLTLAAPAFADTQAAWTWTPVLNKMTDQRWAPSCCLLAGGAACLIAGGYSYQYGWCVPSADIYDESKNKFIEQPGRLHTPRNFATATLLLDGNVLIAGGFNDSLGSLDTAELFNPLSGTFTQLGQNMSMPRELHTATALADGKVLIVGGLDLRVRHTLNSAEIYDPASRSFQFTDQTMATDRFGHAACLLTDGAVLIVGGTSVLFGKNGYAHVLASAEVYDPATEHFSATKSDMTIGRDRPTANLLPDGRVLIAGGQGEDGKSINYSEIYDPKTQTFSALAGSQITDRMAHSTGALPDGHLLLTGGWCATAKSTTTNVEEFDPVSLTFKPDPPLPFSSHDAAQVVFPDGLVLVTGGKSVDTKNNSTSIAAGEIARP